MRSEFGRRKLNSASSLLLTDRTTSTSWVEQNKAQLLLSLKIPESLTAKYFSHPYSVLMPSSDSGSELDHIEFSNSSLEKDLEAKRYTYAEATLAKYWVRGLKNQQLIIFREPMAGDHASQFSLTGETASPLAFPDVVCLTIPSTATLLTLTLLWREIWLQIRPSYPGVLGLH